MDKYRHKQEAGDRGQEQGWDVIVVSILSLTNDWCTGTSARGKCIPGVMFLSRYAFITTLR